MPSHIVILGAGPAGLAAAWYLRRRGLADVTVLEQRDRVGGNAGSFEIEGIPVDYGSHRLHPACDPAILNDLRGLLGPDLLDRPRHGRIRLRGRWIHFPLKPLDLMLRLPPSFALGVARDSLVKLVRPRRVEASETFASVTQDGLGATICRDFYFPYARKIWGLAPTELSAVQARRRVAAGSLGKMVRKVLALVPGLKAPGAGRFFYPLHGYGQISEALAAAATRLGADVRLGVTVRTVHRGDPHRIETEHSGARETITADHVWSTIPITGFARLLQPAPPSDVFADTQAISYRAMVLIYVVADQAQFTPFDAHYFPAADIPLTRLSEPKNYAARTQPTDRTILCGELPCTVGDQYWEASDAELGELVCRSLAQCGIPLRAPVRAVVTKRLPFAYPIYRTGYEEPFNHLDKWVGGLERILSFGRQGLFAHDNTHHTIAMAHAAVACLSDTGTFDQARWRRYRAEFDTHVVED